MAQQAWVSARACWLDYIGVPCLVQVEKEKNQKDEMSFRKHQETKEQHHKSQQRYSNDGGHHHHHRHHEFKENSYKKKSSGDFHAGFKFQEDSKHRHKRDPRQLNPKKFGREKSREIRLNWVQIPNHPPKARNSKWRIFTSFYWREEFFEILQNISFSEMRVEYSLTSFFNWLINWLSLISFTYR